jgi:hypothetical protein
MFIAGNMREWQPGYKRDLYFPLIPEEMETFIAVPSHLFPLEFCPPLTKPTT